MYVCMYVCMAALGLDAFVSAYPHLCIAMPMCLCAYVPMCLSYPRLRALAICQCVYVSMCLSYPHLTHIACNVRRLASIVAPTVAPKIAPACVLGYYLPTRVLLWGLTYESAQLTRTPTNSQHAHIHELAWAAGQSSADSRRGR